MINRGWLTAAIAAVGAGGCTPEAERTPPSVAASASSEARPAAALASAANTLTCDGPITPTTTEAQLRERFGAANVTTGTIDAAEGQSLPAMLVHAEDPARRLEIVWSVNAPRRILSVAPGPEASAWTGPSGLRLGSTLADVERANGRPFQLGGFGWDYGGYVLDWKDGAFATADAPCRLGIRMSPGDDATGDGAQGEGAFASDSPAVRSQKPTVSEWSIDFNVPGAIEPEATP